MAELLYRCPKCGHSYCQTEWNESTAVEYPGLRPIERATLDNFYTCPHCDHDIEFGDFSEPIHAQNKDLLPHLNKE